MPARIVEVGGLVRGAIVALAAAASLAGCKPAAEPAPVAQTVAPGPGIVVESIARYAAPGDPHATRDEYYVVRLTFTNTTDDAIEPRADRFVYVDAMRRRYLAFDAGAPVVAGVENARVTLERGQSHEYTVAFRVPQSATGTLLYDPLQ